MTVWWKDMLFAVLSNCPLSIYPRAAHHPNCPQYWSALLPPSHWQSPTIVTFVNGWHERLQPSTLVLPQWLNLRIKTFLGSPIHRTSFRVLTGPCLSLRGLRRDPFGELEQSQRPLLLCCRLLSTRNSSPHGVSCPTADAIEPANPPELPPTVGQGSAYLRFCLFI